MNNVNFKTDEALYKEFKMINVILNEKNQTVITKLIENYVTENKKLIENPEIQKVTQPTLPSFFANAYDWSRYVGKLDDIGYVNMAIRFKFLEYLLLNHKYQKQNKYSNHNHAEFLTFLEDNKDSFDKSDDRRYLVEYGIFRSVKDDLPYFSSDLFSTYNIRM